MEQWRILEDTFLHGFLQLLCISIKKIKTLWKQHSIRFSCKSTFHWILDAYLQIYLRTWARDPQDVEMPMSCWLPKGRRWMAEAELKHGRVAMMACLIFACLELSTKAPQGSSGPQERCHILSCWHGISWHQIDCFSRASTLRSRDLL